MLCDDSILADCRMILAIHVVASGRGTLLASDENAGAILEHDVTGRFR